MIDAYQSTVIAYSDESGILLHSEPSCVGEDWAVAIRATEGQPNGWSEHYEFEHAMEHLGYQAYSRFSIHEGESQLWDDLAWRIDFSITTNSFTDFGEDADVDYTTGAERIKDDDGKWHDISDIVGEHCGHCNERIT